MSKAMENFETRFVSVQEKANRGRAIKIRYYSAEQWKAFLEWANKKVDIVVYCPRNRFTNYPVLHINNLAFLQPCKGLAQNNTIIARQPKTFSTIDTYISAQNSLKDGKRDNQFLQKLCLFNSRNLETGLPSDILKQAFLDISVSPESFFDLRNNVETSLATMSIGHWILGIGDRHLQNILFSVKDGTLTGIDFGYVSDASIRDTAVPEMLTFRLTPRFKCIPHALRDFRKPEQILMACMEIFIRDSDNNFLNFEKKNLLDDESEVSSDWEPKDRIDVARYKLKGYNPIHLVERQLEVDNITRSSDYPAGNIKILHGRQKYNIEARLQEKETVEEQVTDLIDLARNPGILDISIPGLSINK